MPEVNKKVIPLPTEGDIIAVLGEDNEVQGYISKKRPNRLGSAYIVTFQAGLRYIAEMDLTGEQSRVLMYLLSKLDYDNYIRISQTEIADDLHMQKPNVSRAMKRLVERDIVITGPLAGRSRTYRLNPRIAHRGARNYQQTIIEYDELKKRRDRAAETV